MQCVYVQVGLCILRFNFICCNTANEYPILNIKTLPTFILSIKQAYLKIMFQKSLHTKFQFPVSVLPHLRVMVVS